MSDRNRARREPTEEEDQVLQIVVRVVIVLFVVAIIFVGVRLINADPDVTEGREKLEKMEDQNADSIDAAIMARQSILTDDDEEEEEEEESEESEEEDSDSTEEIIHTEVNGDEEDSEDAEDSVEYEDAEESEDAEG